MPTHHQWKGRGEDGKGRAWGVGEEGMGMAGVVVGVCIWAGEPYPMFRPPQCQVLTATSVPVRCNMVIGLEDVGMGPG